MSEGKEMAIVEVALWQGDIDVKKLRVRTGLDQLASNRRKLRRSMDRNFQHARRTVCAQFVPVDITGG